MNATDFDVVGYVYNVNVYCTKCVVDVLKKDGWVHKRAVVKDLNKTLDVLANTKNIDRVDPWEYDTSELPKEILRCDKEYDIDICVSCGTVIGD